MELTELTIKATSEGLRKKEFSAVDVAEAYLKVIEEKDEDVHAYLEVFEDVIDQAKGADERLLRGESVEPLTGIPLAIKDNIVIEGKVASAASKILEHYRATYDATVITKLKSAGALFLGRTNMDEFAMGSSTEQSAFGPTKNPRDLSRVPGGSSGGSAAAVAANMALGALGSDTGGSIRQPAALCGVVGLKPTYGSVSRHGLIALGSSLDVIGPITKTVGDAELLFNAIQGQDAFDSTSIPQKRDGRDVKTIGIPDFDLFNSVGHHGGIDRRVAGVFEENRRALQDLGYTVIDIKLPNIKYSIPAYYIILPAEASTNLARFDGVKYGLHVGGSDLMGDYFKTRGDGFGPEPRRRIMIGTYVLSHGYYDAYYNSALAVRELISRDFNKAFEDVDVIAMPTTAGPAFKIGEKTADPITLYLEDIFTGSANLAGIPALSVPSGTVDGLPVGLQLMAPKCSEERLFSVGTRFEARSV